MISLPISSCISASRNIEKHQGQLATYLDDVLQRDYAQSSLVGARLLSDQQDMASTALKAGLISISRMFAREFILVHR